jgi:biotin carboxyl carrier protein
MSYRILVNGVEAEGAIPDGSVEEIAPGQYSVLLEGRSYSVKVLGSKGKYEAIIGGHMIAVELEDPRDAVSARQAGEQSGRIEIKAAMPGKVVRLLVGVDDSVEPGQSLIVVEAMKMQNELKAAKSGRILKVNVAEGATVAAGQVLIVLE